MTSPEQERVEQALGQDWVAEKIALFLYQWISHEGGWPRGDRDLAIKTTLLRAARPAAVEIEAAVRADERARIGWTVAHITGQPEEA